MVSAEGPRCYRHLGIAPSDGRGFKSRRSPHADAGFERHESRVCLCSEEVLLVAGFESLAQPKSDVDAVGVRRSNHVAVSRGDCSRTCLR